MAEIGFFIDILLGFPGPYDGLDWDPIVSSVPGSGLLLILLYWTLTLNICGFGLDFEQSFPFLMIVLSILAWTDYESWLQRIRLYCRGKENGLLILQSIDQGPFELGTKRNTLGTTPEGGVLLGPERPRTYEDLSDTEKKQYNADFRATNIVLQGLPKDIYKLINHNIEAKTIWDNVKMLLSGSELTKEDRESQLYDEFV
ncbi:hypothetical protein Tco_0230903 [Tanacetum coccineum]